tara:strand:+ start:18 stop:584 length:567 start_codon:yes stop_codon:yes gene_type:complete
VAAAYGPQDKAVRAAYVASNLQRLGHGVADPGRAIARSLAALGFLAMGLSALVAPRHGFSLDHAVPQSSQANLSRLLMQCEITLHQRSEAETLLKAFTLVQMTRHYWGEFAGSLQDLGLSAGPQLLARVDRTLFRPVCGLSPITAWRPIWQRWRAPVVGCGFITAEGIGRESARPRQGIVRMAGNASH